MRCCPRSPSSTFLTVFRPTQLRQLCTPSTLFLPPLPRPCPAIHGHIRTTSTRPRIPTDTTYVTNRQPYAPAPQIRARKGRIRRPILHAYPNSRHSLSAPKPSSPHSAPSTCSSLGIQLIRVPLHHVHSSTSFAMGMNTSAASCTKTRTSFSTTFSIRSSRRYSTNDHHRHQDKVKDTSSNASREDCEFQAHPYVI